MSNILRKQWPEVDRLIRKAFPSNKKRKAILWTTDEARINTSWNGGSRDSHVLLSESGATLDLPPHAGAAQFGGEAPTVNLGDGQVLVTAGTFNGKPATPKLRANEATWRRITPEMFTD